MPASACRPHARCSSFALSCESERWRFGIDAWDDLLLGQGRNWLLFRQGRNRAEDPKIQSVFQLDRPRLIGARLLLKDKALLLVGVLSRQFGVFGTQSEQKCFAFHGYDQYDQRKSASQSSILAAGILIHPQLCP